MTRYCEGSGGLRTFSIGDERDAGNMSGARRTAMVTCKHCTYRGVGMVVRTSQGVDLRSDHVQVPRHKERKAE